MKKLHVPFSSVQYCTLGLMRIDWCSLPSDQHHYSLPPFAFHESHDKSHYRSAAGPPHTGKEAS